MSITAVPASTFAFLKDLSKNNNRDWFNTHKSRYQTEHAYMVELAENIMSEFSKYDEIEPMSGKKSLFRIYRDTRFSKDKTPYKQHFSGQMKRATALRRGGLYFHFQPGDKSFLGGGFWGPNSQDLKRIRTEIAADPDSFRQQITAPAFVKTFGELKGDQVKTAPKGYSKDHPAIDLLRYKQYLLTREFTDEEVQTPGFLDTIVDTFRNMLPFFDYMSAILTTDENGVPLPGLE